MCSESTSALTVSRPMNCTACTGSEIRMCGPKNGEFTSCSIFAVIAGSRETRSATRFGDASSCRSSAMMAV